MQGKRFVLTLGDMHGEVRFNAQKRGMGMAEFVREAVHDHINSDRLPRRDNLVWVKHLLGMHYENNSRIGNNLNQALLRYHEMGLLDEDAFKVLLRDALDCFSDMCAVMRKVEGRIHGI